MMFAKILLFVVDLFAVLLGLLLTIREFQNPEKSWFLIVLFLGVTIWYMLTRLRQSVAALFHKAQ